MSFPYKSKSRFCKAREKVEYSFMIDDFFSRTPFELCKSEKEKLLTKELLGLTEHHIDKCLEYKKIVEALGYDKSKVSSYYDLPLYR